MLWQRRIASMHQTSDGSRILTMFPQISTTLVIGLFLLSLFPLNLFGTALSMQATIDPAVKLISSTSSDAEFSFSLPDVSHQTIIQNGLEIDSYSIPSEADTRSTDGEDNEYSGAELPVISRMFLIPPQSGVEVLVSDVVSRIENDVILMDSTPDRDSDAEGFLPHDIVTIGKPGIMRGYRLVNVTIHPLQWNSQTRELRVVESANVRLNFNTDLNRENIVRNPNRPRPSKNIRRIIRNLVVNPEPAWTTPSRDESSGGSILYVTMQSNSVLQQVERLLDWRRKMGWTADVIIAEDNESRNAIKRDIQEAYDNWEIPPEFIVLVGDAPGLEGNNYTLAYYNKQAGGRSAYETDHDYCELEGDDIFPEAAIGRLVFSNIAMLRTQVDKIINYESDPFLPDGRRGGWQLRAAVAATDYRSGTSSIDICRWFKNVALDHGFTGVSELYWSNQQRTPNPTEFLNDNTELGLSFILYRGWSRMNGYETREVTNLSNGRMLPFVILATCNTGDYGENLIDPTWSYSERYLWATEGGAIGAVGAAGPTHTAYNNSFATTTLRAIFADEIYSQGWATMAGKLALYSHYADRGDIQHAENRGMEAWLTLFYIYNLMGDPAVDLFTTVPERLAVDHLETLQQGESFFEATVFYDERGDVAEDVQVCLYKPDAFQLVERTDSNGEVAFHIDPEWVDEGTVHLTVSGPNLFPYRYEFEIQEADAYLGALGFAIDDDNEGESRGDGDNTANPLERIELNIALTNFGGQQPEGGITLELTSLSPQISVIMDEIEMEEALEPGQIRSVDFLIDINGDAINGSKSLLQLNIRGEGQSWTSSIEIPIEGPQLEFERLVWNGDQLTPGDTSVAFISITNNGSKPSLPVVGRLESLTGTINIQDGDVSFGVIQPGGVAEAEEFVRMRAHQFHMPGTEAEFVLDLQNDDGFRNTLDLSFTVGEVRHRQPFGPDDYGYICIDNTDTSWASHPRYNWIELHEDDDARDTGLRDTGEQRDESRTINLPFRFTYYGEEFDEVTVCTNGWMAFGDHGEVNSGRNRRIPSGEVSMAMLCPFWDDLVTPNDSRIYWKHDEEDNLFIVEWYNLRKLGPRGWNEPTETFEIILYDPEHYPTPTGDGDIVFQYLEVEDNRSAYQNWDTPWATVGIGSPDLTTGLEYTYWGVRHAGAAVLEPERAIKFTTTIQYRTASVTGIVTDAQTGEVLEGAIITTSYGMSAVTDEDGNYEIHDMIVADDYRITAEAEFYNDSTRAGISIRNHDENDQDFALLHPEFNITPEALQIEATYVDSAISALTIENTGNGTLTYQSRRIEPGHNPNETWEQMQDWPISEMTGNSDIQGVVYCDGYWIISGGRLRDRDKWLYRLRYDGRYIDRIPQPDSSSSGIRDMDYYNGAIYAVQMSNELLKINPENGSVLRRWELPEPLEFARAIALDPENRTIFISGTMFGIYEMSFDEEDSSLAWSARHDLVDPRSMNVLKPYGMSWFKDDLDDFYLYLYTKEDPLDDDDLADISIFRVEPKSCLVEYVTSLPELDPSISARGGMCITPLWNSRNWVMAAILDNPNADRIGIFNLAPNFSWIQHTPRGSGISAGESQEIGLTVYTEHVLSGDYNLNLEFLHNARPGITTVPISISVTVDVPESGEPVSPTQYALHQNWPNPFNPETTISYYLPKQGQVNLSVYDMNGRELVELVNGIQSMGEYKVRFDASDLATGVYFYKLRSGSFSEIRKMVLVR